MVLDGKMAGLSWALDSCCCWDWAREAVTRPPFARGRLPVAKRLYCKKYNGTRKPHPLPLHMISFAQQQWARRV